VTRVRRRLFAGLVLIAPAAAHAADGRPNAELFAGYAYTRAGDQDLHGGEASLGVSLSRWIGLEADVSAHSGGGEGLHTSRVLFMAGPTFTYRTSGFSVFTRYLAGGVRSAAGLTVLGVDITETRTDFGMAYGVGVGVRLSERWSARAQGDYVSTRAEGRTESEPRLSIGAAYRFGGP
jgi:opacity protein-like surface antigen